jgi:formylglycine-generating enzyme required for sulfatase activity
MGSRGDQGFPADQLPQHDVHMGPYAIERYEVTNAQYNACVRAGVCLPTGERLNGDNFPVVNVTWNQANAYCTWIGRRLPNEAEWERAARGQDNWEYSWSNRPAPHFEWNAQFHGSPLSFCEASCPVPHFINDVNDGFATTAPVGSFTQILGPDTSQDISKGFKVADMNGNVSEWVSNWYDPSAYQQGYPVDVFGPSSGGTKVYRGGSWATEPLRLATRFSFPPDQRKNDLGFRCVQ